MQIKLWTYVHDCGDGSYQSLFFNKEEDAQDRYDWEEREYGYGTDSIHQVILEIENGILLNPDNINDE